MIGRIVVSIGFAVLLSTSASAQSAADIPPEALKAFTDWNRCLGGYVAENGSTKARPEDIAAQALKLCDSQERITADLFGKRFGSEGRGSIVRYRSTFTAQAIRIVTSDRAGARPSDPLTAWGYCVGEASQKAILETSDSPTKIADDAMASCQTSEKAARAKIKSGNTQEDDKLFALSRKNLRDESVNRAAAAQATSQAPQGVAACAWAKVPIELKDALVGAEQVTESQTRVLVSYFQGCHAEGLTDRIKGGMLAGQSAKYAALQRLKTTPITEAALDAAWAEAPQPSRDCAMAAIATTFNKKAPDCPGREPSYWFLWRLSVAPNADGRTIEAVIGYMAGKAAEAWEPVLR